MIRALLSGPWAKPLAIAAAFIFVGLVIAANAHLVLVASASQPACIPALPGQQPAKKLC